MLEILGTANIDKFMGEILQKFDKFKNTQFYQNVKSFDEILGKTYRSLEKNFLKVLAKCCSKFG